MDDLFLILALLSIVAFFVGLVKPSVFTKFLKERATRKGVVMIFGVATIIFFVLFAVTTEPTTQTPQVAQENSVSESTEQATESDNEQAQSQQEEVVTNQDTQKAEEPKEDTTPKETKTTPAEQTPAPKTDRESTLAILKENASSKWGNDYQMVQYEYNNQVQAYDWVVAQTKYPDIMTKAKTKWSNDYQMVKYEYNNQVEAYEWIMAQTEYLDIMASAKQKWGDDYQMVKYEYNNQVEAYKNL